MGAARPIHDAWSVWLTVRAEFGFDRGVLDGAFEDINERMGKHVLRRGRKFSVDTHEGPHEGCIIGDFLSAEHLARLFSEANLLVQGDVVIAAKMQSAVDELRAALAARPGSYLVPFRARSAKEAKLLDTWAVMLFWPGAPLDQRVAFISGRPIEWQIVSADDPNGIFG